MSDPWARLTYQDFPPCTVGNENIDLRGSQADGYNAALAAVRTEYDRVCAERDAWKADAERLAQLRHSIDEWRADTEIVTAALAAHDRLAAGQTEANQ